jgi:hypothetical protein
MIVMLAFAAICIALYAVLRPNGPVRNKRAPGRFVWNWGRRELTEDEAARLSRGRFRE